MLERCFINQPSKLQLLHGYDRENVLADLSDRQARCVDVYFTSGPVISARVPRGVLSKGWVKRHVSTEDT